MTILKNTRLRNRANSPPGIRYLCLLALAVAPMHAALAGTVTGVVSDPVLERFVEGATVILDGRRTQTNRSGRYTLRDVAAGEYSIQVSAGGYDVQSQTVSVPDTGSVSADFALASGYIEEIIVSGARVSQLIALQRKKSSVNILDAVSSNTVGKLPDFNVAEAIQRLPGLTVEIDQGEGRYPVIRGIDSNLNNVTIDGNAVGAPEGAGRRVALDVVPSDLVSVVEVVKAVTPDMDGNAVGGNINIVTRSAFDSPEPFGNVSARAGYNDMSERVPYGASASWGSTLDADQRWGLVMAGSYYIRRYDTQLYEGLDWSEFTNGAYAPEDARLFFYDIERERIGANINLEFRPTDDRLWYLRTIYNEFTDHERRDQLDFNMARGDQVALSDTLVQNSEGRASREYRQNNQTQKLYNISTGGEIEFGNWTWNGSYTFAHAEEVTPRRIDWEYRSGGGAFPNTVNVAPYYFLFDADAINDPAEFPFRRVRRRTDDIEEDIHTFKTDLRLNDVLRDRPSFVQFGVKYSMRDKFQDRRNSNYEDAVDFTLGDTGLYYFPSDSFFSGLYDFGPALDFGAHEAFFLSNPGMFEFDAESSAIDSIASDYDIQEDLLAAYGMMSVDVGDTTILGGVRVEWTDADYDAYTLQEPVEDINNPATQVSASPSYTNVLPSLHVTHRRGDNIVIRGAWTNTVGRPNFEDIVPRLEYEDEEGSAGNPDLEPFEAMGLDLSFEYYLQPSGIISVGLFYKDIENPIFGRTIEDVVFNGIFLRELSQPENGESGHLLGLEINWEQQFVNLPAPWDGLGASVNFTWIDSEVTVFGREDEDLPFFRQPDKIGNAAIYYTTERFEYRLAANYRDDYLQSIGGEASDDVYFGERTQIDFKVTFRPTDDWQLFGEVQNIDDEPRTEFQGVSSRLAAEEIYGWTALVGATYSFY